MFPVLARVAPLTLIVLPGLCAVVLLAATGGLEAPLTPGIPDPGSLTRWGLPASRALRDAAAAVVIGALTVAAIMLPGDTERPALIGASQRRLLLVVAAMAPLWLVAGVGEITLVYADVSGAAPNRTGIGELWFFATQVEYGQALLASLVLVAVAAYATTLVRTVTGIGVTAVVAVAALWPLALTGHAAGDANHELGVNLQFLHLVPVTVWVGGLAALVLVGPTARSAELVRRFSRVAGWCLLLVATSGVFGALIRLPSPEAAWSSYGVLLSVKVAALGLCLVVGWWHRRRTLASDNPVAGVRFVKLVVAELMVMALAMGAGVALSRTGPPEGADTVPTPAEAILGRPMPPELDASRWLTEWQFDTFWGSAAIAGLILYLIGVRRLARRGARWSPGRTICWMTGLVVLFWATCGPPGSYEDVLFSMHMLQHMTITTAVPVLLVLGAPVTLALRAFHPRSDGSRGAREWLLMVVHSWPSRLLSHPLIAAGLFIVGLVGFYYSDLFELSLRTHTGHLLMTAHFLVSGYLLANVICGVDPGPKRPPYPFRVVLLMLTFAIHAFFSISLMSSQEILAEDWYGGLGRTWGPSLAEDQYLGASIGWAMGDIPLAILAGALVVSWVRDDQRESRRLDRQADRDGDAELARYNAYLQSLDAGPESETEPETASETATRPRPSTTREW